MKRTLALAVFTLTLAACSSPTDVIFGPEPLKQMQEQSEIFSKISKEDRELLVAYIALLELDKTFSGGDVTVSVTGKTVGETLEEAKVWKAKVVESQAASEKAKAEEEAKQQALVQKIKLENLALQEKINKAMTFAITNSKTLPKNYNIGRYSEMLSLTYSVENTGDKTISQIKGTAIFSDLSGERFADLPINFDIKVAPGKTITTDLDKGWKVNEFMSNDINKVAMKSFDQMKISFTPEVVVFSDGETLTLAKVPE